MARFNIQVATAVDTILPRDRIVNVWHFDNPLGLPSNPNKLCEDMTAIYDTIMARTTDFHEFDARLYEENVKGPPLGRHVRNVGKAAAASAPREVAICLSFRGPRNIPSERGRVYLAPYLMHSTALMGRPDTAQRLIALEMATAVSALGGADVDWGVYSPTKNTFVKTEVAWVDDEWDTVRSRGLRATTRSQITTGMG